jgi:hypothetical protein
LAAGHKFPREATRPEVLGLGSKIHKLVLAAGISSDLDQSEEEQIEDLLCICRTAIRDHLLNMDLHENLFMRIPKLPLPTLLHSFLLFDTSLEEEQPALQ